MANIHHRPRQHRRGHNTTNTMTLAEHLLEDITKALADGRTVYVATALKATKVTPSTAASWEASGHQLFKLDKKGDLTMAKGRKYVPITFCSGQYLYCTVKITP